MRKLLMVLTGSIALSGISAGAEARSYGSDARPALQDQQRDRYRGDDYRQDDQRRYDRRDESYRRQGNGDARWRGDRDGNWDPSSSYQDGNYRERQLSRNDRVYRGSDGRYYCKRSNGTTGLVIGAVGGGVLGNVLGGGTLGTLLGAGGGALLGRSVERNNDDRRNSNNGYRCR